MQKTTSTVIIAFLSGLVVAGGVAYFVSDERRPAPEAISKPAPAQQVSAVAPEPIPEAPQEQPEVQEPANPPAAERPHTKPRPVTRQHALTEEESTPAQQPVQSAEVAQNTPAALPAPATPAEPSPAPKPAQPLSPPPDTQSAPPPPAPKTIKLASGTDITVRINENISTNTNYTGDTFTASLDHPIIVDGFVIADRGSRVIGKVLKAEKAGRVKGVADLSLALTQIHTTDGQTVNIQTTPWDKEGPTSKKRDTAEIAGGAALGAIIGAIAGGGKGAAIGAGAGGAAGTGTAMATRGKPAEIEAETRVTFSLSNDVGITEHFNQ